MSPAALYMAQRLSALVMAPFVLGHLAVMIYAIQGGLSAAEILSRTQGSVFWALFYGGFVIAVSIHGAIGLRGILLETGRFSDRGLDIAALAIGAVLLGMGLNAVYAVTVS